jgi:hypothetical protein
LDNVPSAMVPWWANSIYILDGFYSCTLSTPGQTRTFATTVTAGDNVTKRTYSISMKR